ncbi:flavin-containing monooxygenase family protein [Wolffia australiana]
MKTEVVIVGAGPSGLAVAACLNRFSIANIIIEREDCHSSLWKKRAYDRVKLHLAKQFCELPHMHHSPSTSTFMSKDEFVRYLDEYVAFFGLRPLYNKSVEKATFDYSQGIWTVRFRDVATGEAEEYSSLFLVAATGENNERNIPNFPGLSSFLGEVIHSCEYKSGARFATKHVLVVGSGNSGMEIAYDLCQHGAKTSISVRGPLHVLNKDIVHAGMVMLRRIPIHIVDALVILMARLQHGDLSQYGLLRPKEGPFSMKAKTGRSPVIDVGTVKKIKSGEIKVMKEVIRISGANISFAGGSTQSFDAIILATGYRSGVGGWLKDGGRLLNVDGFPKRALPDHWKGTNGLFFAGLSRRGLIGAASDAMNIAEEIKQQRGGSSDSSMLSMGFS